MSQGTEQEIVNADKTIYNAYRAEIQQLGPDHTNYAAADRARMEKILRHILRAEGIARE